jgi:hypothetical protein
LGVCLRAVVILKFRVYVLQDALVSLVPLAKQEFQNCFLPGSLLRTDPNIARMLSYEPNFFPEILETSTALIIYGNSQNRLAAYSSPKGRALTQI